MPVTPPVEKTVPGAIKADGTLIATVNGVAIKDGIVDSLMKDIPAEQRAMIMAGPQFAQLKDQLVTTEVLYQEAIKAKIHEDPDAQLMMSLTAREVLQDFLVKKLANERMTDAKLQEWYDEHLVQFQKDSADLFMLATQEEAAANEALKHSKVAWPSQKPLKSTALTQPQKPRWFFGEHGNDCIAPSNLFCSRRIDRRAKLLCTHQHGSSGIHDLESGQSQAKCDTI